MSYKQTRTKHISTESYQPSFPLSQGEGQWAKLPQAPRFSGPQLSLSPTATPTCWAASGKQCLWPANALVLCESAEEALSQHSGRSFMLSWKPWALGSFVGFHLNSLLRLISIALLQKNWTEKDSACPSASLLSCLLRRQSIQTNLCASPYPALTCTLVNIRIPCPIVSTWTWGKTYSDLFHADPLQNKKESGLTWQASIVVRTCSTPSLATLAHVRMHWGDKH